jgi:hypothetical protein
MSGCFFALPVLIPVMEIPTTFVALGMLGFELVKNLRDFTCANNTSEVDHVFRNKSGLKIGIRKNKQGKLELLVDEDELRAKEGIELKEFKQQIQKQYAYVQLKDRLKAEGYTVVEEKEEANESIRLVVRRWR